MSISFRIRSTLIDIYQVWRFRQSWRQQVKEQMRLRHQLKDEMKGFFASHERIRRQLKDFGVSAPKIEATLDTCDKMLHVLSRDLYAISDADLKMQLRNLAAGIRNLEKDLVIAK